LQKYHKGNIVIERAGCDQFPHLGLTTSLMNKSHQQKWPQNGMSVENLEKSEVEEPNPCF
jgi:hypothetical protein